MARHRNVRTMNYEDEYDGYDDVYGHSVEDDHYCVSPGTASQFLYDRGTNQKLSSFFSENEQIPEEELESEESDAVQDSTGSFTRPAMSATDEAKLNSCLEAIRDIVGDTTPEHVLATAIIESGFDHEKALNTVLNQQEAPKPQREPKPKRQNRGNKLSRVSTEPQFTVVPDDEFADTVVSAQSSDLSNNVAKLTFTSSKPVASGFTPEKKESGGAAAAADAGTLMGAKRNLGASLGGGGGVGAGLRPVASAPNLQHMGSTPKKEATTPSKSKHDKVDTKAEFEKRKAEGKDYVNLVVIGHVDAGKSTLMGHVLFQLGFVNKKTMHKYEQESKKLGKASFAYAWVLDETEEERTRGVTMDVAQTRFETKTKTVTLLDAPGHKDFIPNMITGAAQADVAILVVNATRGEFETGFDAGGQTREHAMLIRSLGVSQLCVAVNKMDTVEWSEERYKEITKKLRSFLKQTGFREEIPFIPCSGLNGENLCKPATDPALQAWYTGPTLVEQIDQFKAPERAIDKPFRMCAGDIFKGMGAGFSVSGTIQSGSIQTGEKVLIMPQGEVANVKNITVNELPYPTNCAFAGDNIILTITGVDMTNIGVGSILCDPANPVKTGTRIKARVVTFTTPVPITKGFNVVFHYQSMNEPAYIKKIISLLDKSTGLVTKKNPRCLTPNCNAMIQIELDRPICIELYKDFKDLGRFMLRYAGSTVAAGLVTDISNKKPKTEA